MKSSKKTFVRTWYTFGFGAFVISVIIGMILAVIIRKLELVGYLIFGGIVVAICIYVCLYFACYWITFYDDKIYVSDEKIPVGDKIQYKDTVYYSNIIDIRVVFAYKNSLKLPLSMGYKPYATNKQFVELIEKNKTSWIYVTGFTSKQKQKMLDIIGEKTGIYKNYKQLQADAKERLKQEQGKWKI